MIQTSLVYLSLVSGHTCFLSQPLDPNHIDMLIYGYWLSKSFSLLDSNLVSSRQLLRLSGLLVRNLNPLRLPPAVSNLGCSVTRFDFSWAGTENSDQARDFSLALKDRFYLQPLPPVEAAASAKESAKDIINVKSLIDKKAWPYVQNDLRLKASYLRYDLNTIISSKSKDKKKSLKDLTGKLFDTINNLDYAAKKKSTLDNLKAAVNSTRKLCVVCYSMLFFW